MRVISASEGAQRKAEADLAVSSPAERRRAAERFEQTRTENAAARTRLVAAARRDADARSRADAALAVYEAARVEARRTTVELRQRQRQATDTKLALRRALEWVARLEALDDRLDLNEPGTVDLRDTGILLPPEPGDEVPPAALHQAS